MILSWTSQAAWPEGEPKASALKVLAGEEPSFTIHPKALGTLSNLPKTALTQDGFREPFEDYDYHFSSALSPEDVVAKKSFLLELNDFLEESGFQSFGLDGLSVQGLSPGESDIFGDTFPYMPFSHPVCLNSSEGIEGARLPEILKIFLNTFPQKAFQIAVYNPISREVKIDYIYVIFHRDAQESDPRVSLDDLQNALDTKPMDAFYGWVADLPSIRDETQSVLIKYFSTQDVDQMNKGQLVMGAKQLGISTLFCNAFDRSLDDLIPQIKATPFFEYILNASLPSNKPNHSWFSTQCANALLGDLPSQNRGLMIDCFFSIFNQALAHLGTALLEADPSPHHHAIFAKSLWEKALEDPRQLENRALLNQAYQLARQVHKTEPVASVLYVAAKHLSDSGIFSVHAEDKGDTWLQKAAEEGYEPAQEAYGKKIIRSGDLRQALEGLAYLRTIALKKESPDLAKFLARAYLGEFDRESVSLSAPKKALFWLDGLALSGDVGAQKSLLYLLKAKTFETRSQFMTKIYQKGVVLRKKAKEEELQFLYKKAFDFFLLDALFTENPNAMYNLGYILHALEEYRSAYDWFSEAAKREFPPAKNSLAQMEEENLLKKEQEKIKAFRQKHPDDLKYRYRLYLTHAPRGSSQEPISVTYSLLSKPEGRFKRVIEEDNGKSDFDLIEKYVFGEAGLWPNYQVANMTQPPPQPFQERRRPNLIEDMPAAMLWMMEGIRRGPNGPFPPGFF